MALLPSELWLSIFEELIYEPTRTLEIGYEPFTEDEHITPTSAQAAEWMQRKCDIVLVCKTWRRLALPFLYEVLLVDSEARARMICGALELTAEPSTPGNSLVDRGAFVRQIYICAQWNQWHFFDEGAAGHHVPRIVQRCPNLTIFSYRILALDFILHPTFSSIVNSGAVQSLRRLDLSGKLSASHLKSGERGIGNLPNLETLVLPSEVDGLRISKIGIRAPNVRTLVLSWEMYKIMTSHASRFDLPKLRWIHILPINAIPPYTIFAAPGTSAIARTMNNKVVSFGFHQSSTSSLCVPFDLLAQFPNLEHARLRVLSMATPERRLHHPSITCIALRPGRWSTRVLEGLRPNETGRPIRGTLAKIDVIIEVLLAGHFPQLRRIQIVGPYRGTCADKMEWIGGWTKRLGERGIDFEISRTYE
ncbi:hypothetical protein EVG20_g733 [Dentipellis fragilis]|uniref:F-box domain-containing protein n=1 Tax=Dentipellis fragilis TaxID=205917 RepID=A0A4Y9ZDN9_9AGAM|nr:hypothetical protein EVG20_g733 [Dentipellis fragilis]